MEKKDKGFESYEPPKLEVLEIMVEQAVLQASGYGPDSDDSELDTVLINYFLYSTLNMNIL